MAKKSNSPGANKLQSQHSVNAAVKSICDSMRRSNCAGAMKYVPELTWILFLRILDEREACEADEAAALGLPLTPSLSAVSVARLGRSRVCAAARYERQRLEIPA
jgi:type I restriction enzyme M protein